jgi:hypothetical protein
MRKLIRRAGFILITVFVLLSLSSCEAVLNLFFDLVRIEPPELEGPTFVDVEAEQRNMTEAILQALDDHDSETLKGMFCEYARELPELDQQIQAAMDFYEGKLVSYDKDDSILGGGGYKEIEEIITLIATGGAVYDISTDAGKRYAMSFSNYLVYWNHPESVGLSVVRIKSLDTEEECEIGSYYYVKKRLRGED